MKEPSYSGNLQATSGGIIRLSYTRDRPMPETAKDVARRIVEQSPEQATLDDIMYRLYVHQKLEAGLAAAEQGEVISHQQVKSRLLCGDD